MSEQLPKKPEQRHYQRVDMELPVRLEFDGRVIESTTENISCGGMFLPKNNASSIKKDDLLTAFITLPETKKEIRMTGKICRIQKNADNTSALAIQFSGQDENHPDIDHLIRWRRHGLN